MLTSRRWTILLFVVLGLAAFNVLYPIALSGVFGGGNPYLFPPLFGIIAGATAGQVGLAVTWSVLGRQSIFTRLPGGIIITSLVVYSMLFGCWTAEHLAGSSSFNSDVALGSGLGILNEFLFFSLLLWLLSALGDWRITHTDRTESDCQDLTPQFGIRHLLIGTTSVAIILSMGRMFVTADFWEWNGNGVRIARFLAPAAFIALIPLFLATICTRLSLSEKRNPGQAVIIILFIGAVVSSFEFFVLLGFNWLIKGSLPSSKVYLTMLFTCISFNASHIGVQFSVLSLLRRWGYRITRWEGGPEEPLMLLEESPEELLMLLEEETEEPPLRLLD